MTCDTLGGNKTRQLISHLQHYSLTSHYLIASTFKTRL